MLRWAALWQRAWYQHGGFIGAYPQLLDAFTEKVVPILQQRGLFRIEYAGSTLRAIPAQQRLHRGTVGCLRQVIRPSPIVHFMKRNTIKHRPARTGLVALVAAIIGVVTVAIGCRRFRRG